MKFAALVLKSAVRNKRRTLRTVLSLGASRFLPVTPHTVLYELQATSTTPQSGLRLWSRHAVSIARLSRGERRRHVLTDRLEPCRPLRPRRPLPLHRAPPGQGRAGGTVKSHPP